MSSPVVRVAHEVADNRRTRSLRGVTKLAVALFACLLVAPAVAAAADPQQVSFTLEGCRPDAPITFPANGPFICADADYTSGNLGKFWNEGDYVPYRITTDNNNGAQTYDVTIAADYRLDDALGYDSITVPALNDPLSDDACTDLTASALSYATGAAAVGGIDGTIYRTLTIAQPAGATCVYDYAMRLSISFPGRTAADAPVPAPLGASFYSGSSLHGYLLNADLASAGIGQKRVPIPVNEIEPQGFLKTVDGARGTGFVWGVTKSSGPAGFPNTCTGATTSDPVSIRVEWTKTAISAGQVAVTTTFIFDNPSHRPLDVAVEDTLFTDAGMGTQLDSFNETETVNPGHREFSYTRQVTTASATLFNTAVATYTDPHTGDEFGQIEATDAGTVTDLVGAAANNTATISDVEQITGGMLFSVESVTTSPALPNDSLDAGYTLGDPVAGPLTWTSGTVSASGSVTFSKLVHVQQGLTTSGSLSDVATLTPSDSDAIVASASTPIQAVGCATVSGLKFNDANRDGLQGQNEPGLGGWTFYVDYNANGALDQGEPSAVSAADGTWTITGVQPGTYPVREVSQAGWVCTAPAPCEYSVTLNGNASTGNVFGNYRLTPSILLDKTGPATAEAGSLVPYTINITNNGDLPLSSVVVTDPLCTAAPTLVSKNGDLSPDTLDPAVDQWTYTCSVQTTVGQTSVDNVANVTAQDEFQTTVTSTDNAVTTLSQPVVVTVPVTPPAPLVEAPAAPAPVTGSAVLAETSPPAAQAAAAVSPSARLVRPTRCASRPFTATVVGRRIARVRFYVDGRLVATLRRAGTGGRWGTRINPASYRAGSSHRLVARIQFAASTNRRQSVQSYAFSRCGVSAQAPAFTG